MKLLKAKSKLILVALTILLLCGLLLGCTQNQPAEPNTSVPPNGTAEPAPTPEDPAAAAEAYTYQDNQITFKGYNAATDQTETYTYQIPEGTKSTLYSILDAYNTAYKIPILKGDPIAANTIELKDGTLKIDFTSSIYGNYGSGMEAALVDNLLMAFFENIPETDKIYISVDQKAYETGHIMYNLDEAITKADIS